MIRSFDIVDCEQGSTEWMIARAGRVTGSCADIVMMKPLPSGGEAAGKKDYRLKLAVERITGIPQFDDFTSRHMRRGVEMEPLARVLTEQKHGVVFRETGFLRHKHKMIGVSLDGDAGDFSMICELKCPKSVTHLQYLQAGKLPAAYRWQVIHGLYVTGASYCIFTSFDDRMPEGLQLFTIEVAAEDLPIKEYAEELDRFLLSVDNLEQKLLTLQKEKLNGKV